MVVVCVVLSIGRCLLCVAVIIVVHVPCPLSVVCCLLFVVCCVLLVVGCSLLVLCRLVCVVCCVSFAGWFLLFGVC